ncbi:MAG: 30S ribosome-binding factor RbfA [Marinilabiliaceae bacterium]|nr:30S ribosome-binding factor RbfA [Bacteroidales bacterium]MDD5816846.1 30S ribosome-binding factor RbfA [Bacteroidales bacterium]MDY4520528.1 30S ribosome-binding factor RbfA [Bacteroidales bacterium]
MESTRQKKISRLLQKETAEMLQRELSELLMGTMVSVTIARVSSDLSVVKFYISVFPDAKAEAVLKNLNDNIGSVRYALGKRIGKQLRIVPEPVFFIDDSLGYLENIDRLLDQEKREMTRPEEDVPNE